MITKYNKVQYDSPFGYRLNHTVGMSAEHSTLGYPHVIKGYLLFYFIHGSGNIKVEGKNYEIAKGDMILLSPAELFHCTVDYNMFHERIGLHFSEKLQAALPIDGSFLFRAFREREHGSGNRIPASVVKEHGLDVLMDSLLTLTKSGHEEDMMMAYCRVVELLTKLSKMNLQFESGEESKGTLIDDVLMYLNNHFTEEITVAEIATRFFVDKSYLSHLFTEHVGMPLWTYIILRRLNLFNELVREGGTVEETSQKVGFRNYSNFFRLYKKYMNMTPTQYKKSVLDKG